jgi:hypothetical protein
VIDEGANVGAPWLMKRLMGSTKASSQGAGRDGGVPRCGDVRLLQRVDTA